jgi:hypothetical protein
MSAGNDQNYGCRGGVEAPNQQPLKIKTIEIDPTVPGGYFNRSMDMRLMFVQPQPTEGAIAQAFTRLASVNGYTRLLEESQQTTKVYSTSKRWVLLCENQRQAKITKYQDEVGNKSSLESRQEVLNENGLPISKDQEENYEGASKLSSSYSSSQQYHSHQGHQNHSTAQTLSDQQMRETHSATGCVIILKTRYSSQSPCHPGGFLAQCHISRRRPTLHIVERACSYRCSLAPNEAFGDQKRSTG